MWTASAAEAPGRGIEPRWSSTTVADVLLVEDDATDQLYVKRTLRNHFPAANLRIVASLRAARAAIDERAWDCIIVDHRLPDGDAMELLAELQPSERTLPLVLLTGTVDPDLGGRAIRLGAQDYLVKGQMEMSHLARSIRHAMERAAMVMELQRSHDEVERLSIIDPLTGLLNRRGLERQLVRENALGSRNGTMCAAILIDCDDFKHVNTIHGHAAGDAVLAGIASALVESSRESDHVARIGGDEFVMLLPATSVEDAGVVARRAQVQVRDTLRLDAAGLPVVTVSCGVVPVDVHTAATTDILRQAERTLAKSKELGKDRVSAKGSPGTRSRAATASPITELLNDPTTLRVAWQPVFASESLRRVGGELLIRGPEGPIQSPLALFQAARAEERLVEVDLACASRCVGAIAEFDLTGIIGINLFPTTLRRASLTTLLDLLQPVRDSVCVEINECYGETTPGQIKSIVAAIQEAGFMIALDDLVLSTSSLESLVLLRPDILKIDKRCVTGNRSTLTVQQQLQRLAELARCLGVKVVAEGIETEADLMGVRDVGIPLAQGYHLGRPTILDAAIAHRLAS